MNISNDNESSRQTLSQALDVSQAVAEAVCLIHKSQLQRQMMYMDIEVANVLTDEEFAKIAEFKQACLSDLGAHSSSDISVGLLRVALEKGFTLGYWLARQSCNEANVQKG